MLYICKIIRFRKWKALLIFGLLSLALGIRIFMDTLNVSVVQLTELHKCPACYGVSACSNIFKNKIKIEYSSLHMVFANLFSTKNVYYATNGIKPIVLKKLAHTAELDAFDTDLCTDPNLIDICPRNINQAQTHNIDFYSRIIKEISLDYETVDGSRLRLCPSTDRIDLLFYNVFANSGNDKKIVSQAYLWTMIKINPEPLILQILSIDNAWPVPKYLGACGRLVLEEYAGQPLNNFHSESWMHRAKIASRLLRAARMFTFRNPDFGFYLTDISPENIAVDSQYEIKFVDLENIIVVDKKLSTKNDINDWHKIHTNNFDFECQNCLTFSPMDICSHQLSDHNYYAVCQHLLSEKTSATSIPGGLLHDIPVAILEKYPNLSHLIEQCAVPDLPNNRISFGDHLKEMLDDILDNLT
ncbi:deleted in autism protein 1 homolog [Cephus cinctus]|uniref:Deleted in autism protein 1 homolog n=1 Tax=Cephus cinctus TaxID=211228 RepID=A0AAJ7C584_CEPCN|nr:deleted in autism protein 1 homolog [Cephus cinctus]